MVGLEHDGDKKTGFCSMFNMIREDGTRSSNAMSLRGKERQRYDYLLPENKKIIAVTIHYYSYIYGFVFYFSDGSDWSIGRVSVDEEEDVEIDVNEVIVGFRAKSDPDCPAIYTEWQLITAR